MGVAARLSDECSVFNSTTFDQPDFQIVLSHGDKQIRYYPPYLIASTSIGRNGPELHVKELAASFVAVLESTSNESLSHVKSNTAALRQWVIDKTPFRPSLTFSPAYLKQGSLFTPVSTSFYWE